MFRLNPLLGAAITSMTDHMNLTHDDIQSTRLLNWRLLIEEFAPTLTYVKGIDNTGSDFLSRYLLEEEKPTPWLRGPRCKGCYAPTS